MAAWDVGQGYAHKGGRKEPANAYEAFTCYRELGGNRSHKAVCSILGWDLNTVKAWASKYAWRERTAAWDASQIQVRFNEARSQREAEHRAAIIQFRDDQARRARAMGELAELMMDLTREKLLAMQAAGELPSEQQLSNLAKTVGSLGDTAMNLAATALGVDELLDSALLDDEP